MITNTTIINIRLVCAKVLLTSCLMLAALPAAAQSPVQKVQLAPASAVASLSWQSLATDAAGDGNHPRLPDAKELFYALDAKTQRVWFKVTLHNPLPEGWFGMNIVIDSDDNADNGMAWWGTNKIKFDLLASAYLAKGEGYWQGVVGLSDSAGAGRTVFDSLSRDVLIAVDREQPALLLGAPRAALGARPTIRVIATVGSTLVNNDDIGNEGMATVKLTP
jgi:hypothetical protein